MGYRTMAELHDKSNGSLGWKIDNEWWFTCYGVSSLYTDLGDCAWSCEHCAAMFWYGERLKGYSKVQTVRYHKPEKREDAPYVIQKLGQHLIISTTLRAAAGAVKREDDQRLFHNAAMRKQRSDVSDRWNVFADGETTGQGTDISQKDEKPSKKRQNRTRDGKVCEDEAQSKSSQLREEKAKKNIT
ncbi:hypothetical protein Tco_1078022 [Tanacetum coccineum]